MSQGIADGKIRPDLHLHSAFSDGLYSPCALCERVEEAKVTHVSLCDHDTLAGIAPMRKGMAALNARRQEEGEPCIAFLPGLELSAGRAGGTHILGYGAEPENAFLKSWLEEAQKRRHRRFFKMVEKLSRLGYTVPEKFLPSRDTELPLGRAHLARVLIQTGVVNTMTQAFGRFLGEGRSAYVAYEHLSAIEAIRLLRKAHIVPVLAHPTRMGMAEEEFFALATAMQEAGLMGLEVFHPSASRSYIHSLEAFARRRKLLVTGGSDFHGDANTAVRLGKLPERWTKAREDIEELMSAMQTA